MLTSSGNEWGLGGSPPLLPTVQCCAQQSWHRLHLNAVQLQSSWRQREARWCHGSWGALVSWEPITARAERLNPGVPAKEGAHSHRLGALPPEELEEARWSCWFHQLWLHRQWRANSGREPTEMHSLTFSPEEKSCPWVTVTASVPSVRNLPQL